MGLLNQTHAQDEFAKATNEFAVETYVSLRSPSENAGISPISINLALALVLEGANGTSRERLQELLHLKEIADFTTHYDKLIQALQFQNSDDYQTCIRVMNDMGQKTGENRFDIFNAVWYEESSPLSPDYLERIRTHYNADTKSYEKGDRQSANAEINAWVQEKTHGRISQSNPSLTEDGPTALLNVVYFKSLWDTPFDKKKTKEEKFFSLEKVAVPKDFMHATIGLSYYEDKDLQAVSLPYQCSSLSMILVLPKGRYELESVESSLTGRRIETIRESMRGETVILSLPKFRIEQEYELSSWLREKGIITGEFQSLPFQLSSVIHKTFIEVTEKETEAAALTEMVITGGVGGGYEPPPPKVFNANHPFMFWIIDNQSRQVLFMGRIVR